MAQSSDTLTTHIIRLRFFRFLIIASLLLLGVCALQVPFGESEDDANSSAPKVAAQSINGQPTNRSEAKPAEKPQRTKVEPKPEPVNSPPVISVSRGGPNDPLTQPDAELSRKGPVDQKVGELDLEIAKNGHLGNLVFDLASAAGRQIGKASQVSPPLPRDWLSDPIRRSPSQPTAQAKPPAPESLEVSGDPPAPKQVATNPEPARVSPEPPAVKPMPVKPTSARVVLVNPPETGVALGFLVDGQEYTLAAGERHELRGNADGWAVRFHRGGERDDVDYYLTRGAFRFGASHDGWLLEKTDVVNE